LHAKLSDPQYLVAEAHDHHLTKEYLTKKVQLDKQLSGYHLCINMQHSTTN
jgi:hypothetical protein